MRKPSPAKAQVIDFLKSTGFGKTYTFEFEGTEAEAKSYIHNMRVQLSRLRGYVRNNMDSEPVPFRMELVSIQELPSEAPANNFGLPPPKQKITIRKSNYDTQMHEDIQNIFEQLTI